MSREQDFLERLCGHSPHHVAAQCAERTWTYGELAVLIERAQRALHAAGVDAGDRVVIALPDGMEMLVAILATLRAGAVAVPTMHPLGEDRARWLDEEVQPAQVLSPSGAVPVIVDPSLELHGRASASPSTARSGAPSELAAGVPSRPAVIRFTSGSTGQPKGVVLDRDQIAWSARTLSQVYGLDRDHRELVVAPMAFSGAWQRVAATLWGGGRIVFFDGLLSLPGLLESVSADEITGFFTPPPLLRMMLGAEPERVSTALETCRSIEFGSAPLTNVELERFAALVPRSRIFFHYGLTECSRAAILDLRAHPEKSHTVGRPAPDTQIAIRSPDGHELPPGAHGEIHVTGPQRSRAYWRRGQAVDTHDAWLATGDHGYLDDEGFLVYAGREDDLIVSGGFSFFPAEVEAELGEIAGIEQYLIAGVAEPDDVLGQVPWAFVVAAEGAEDVTRRFLEAAKAKLPRFRIPRRVVLVPALPITASGKPDRASTVRRFAHSTDDPSPIE